LELVVLRAIMDISARTAPRGVIVIEGGRFGG